MSDSRLYSRLLLPKGHGYPLFRPQPFDDLPLEARRTGTEIGDVGIITSDGGFDMIFNICRAADDPINRFGVPEGFEQVILDHGDIAPRQQYHRPGSHVSNTQLRKRRLDVDINVSNVFVPLDVGAVVEVSTASKEAALLLLPDGASRVDLRRVKRFHNYALKHALQWYEFVNEDLERMVDSGDLYLVTGCDKSSSWSVAALGNHADGCGISLKLKACSAGSAVAACAWEWEAASSFADSGPRKRTGEEDWTDNQTIFLRGYKVAIRSRALTKKSSTKVLSIVDSKVSDILSKVSLQPRSDTSSFTGFTLRPPNMFRRGASPRDTDSIPEISKPYHPADVINAYLLESFPDALVAATHDTEWISVIDAEEKMPQDDRELLSRICDKYKPEVSSNRIYLTHRGLVDTEGVTGVISRLGFDRHLLAPAPFKECPSNGDARAADDFEDASENLVREKLALLGYCVLELVVTRLIMEIYPDLGVDVSTVIRQNVIDDSTLGKLSVEQQLFGDLKEGDSLQLTPAETNSKLFKVHIGDLYNTTGYEATATWLNDVLQPYTISAYNVLFPSHEPIQAESSVSTVGSGTHDSSPLPSSPDRDSGASYIALFNEQLQKGHQHPDWMYTEGLSAGKEKDAHAHASVKPGHKASGWLAEVAVEGEIWGRGVGNTKRAARNECARQALERMGVPC